MLVKFQIAPGVYRNVTPYQGETRWYDTNLVRWVGEMMEPIGGWQKFSLTPVTGICRGLFAWRDNSQRKWLAIGTNERLYVHDDGELYNITPVGFTGGLPTSVPGLGFGTKDYGEEAFGTPRTGAASLIVDAASWTFDSWGENLIGCCNADGKIYEWALSTGDPAVAVANAPVNNTAVFVSEQRHLVALGAGGDPRKIQWSDAEDNTEWTPSSTNQAGDWLLNSTGLLRCAVKTRGETLILTTSDVHVMRFIGSPLVFSFDRVSGTCGIASANAAVSMESGVVWMGSDARIYAYNGAVQSVPCDVEDWIETEIDKGRLAEVYGGALSEHGEVWWFFPSLSGVTKYVIWSYRTGVWIIGELDRIAWMDRGIWRYPIGASSDGYLYQHEQGLTDSGVTRVGDVYAESGAMEIYPGEQVADILQVLPDEKNNGDVQVTLKCKFTPNGTETTYGPYTVRSDGYTDVRASGRQAKIRVEGANDSDWRVGTFRADIRLGAKR